MANGAGARKVGSGRPVKPITTPAAVLETMGVTVDEGSGADAGSSVQTRFLQIRDIFIAEEVTTTLG